MFLKILLFFLIGFVLYYFLFYFITKKIAINAITVILIVIPSTLVYYHFYQTLFSLTVPVLISIAIITIAVWFYLVIILLIFSRQIIHTG